MNEKSLDSLLKKLKLTEGTLVNIVSGKRDEILQYIPFERFNNNASGTDSSHEESASILDSEGNVLCFVESGYSSTYSDGSKGGGKGESVREAIAKLGAKANLAKYVLLSGKDEKQDNAVVVSEGRYHKFKGLVTEHNNRLTLYEL